MTYAIGQFIFGVNFLKAFEDSNFTQEMRENVDELVEADLIQSSYSGSGDMPVYLGVDVDQIDECSELEWSEIVDVKDKLKAAMAPGSAERVEYVRLLTEVLNSPDITQELSDWLARQEPAVFLTWGSS